MCYVEGNKCLNKLLPENQTTFHDHNNLNLVQRIKLLSSINPQVYTCNKKNKTLDLNVHILFFTATFYVYLQYKSQKIAE